MSQSDCSIDFNTSDNSNSSETPINPSISKSDFPEKAVSANPVFYRTYSRVAEDGKRESFQDVLDRNQKGLAKLGRFTLEEAALTRSLQQRHIAMPSGRWMWVGGTEWLEQEPNFYGAYNCSTTVIDSIQDFCRLMNLSMMGVGVGWLVENGVNVEKFPSVKRKINLEIIGEFGAKPSQPDTNLFEVLGDYNLVVGDSRQGWVESLYLILDCLTGDDFDADLIINLIIDISHVRKADQLIKGFGGKSNPRDLTDFYTDVVNYLNDRADVNDGKLTSVDLCWLGCRVLQTVVAGNIRRCLPEDALVHTDKGLVPIKDIQVGDLVHTPFGLRKVTDKFDQGMQDVFEVVAEAGSFYATLNHKVAIRPRSGGYGVEWVTVSELQKGDVLHSSSNEFDQFEQLGNSKFSHTYDIEVEEIHCFYCDGYLMHNSAGMVQGAFSDKLFQEAKSGLWNQNADGAWVVDPQKDALRMANFTRVSHTKPSFEACLDAVTSQYYSSEGAIMYAPEAIARGNADLLNTPSRKKTFIDCYCSDKQSARLYLSNLAYKNLGQVISDKELDHRLMRYLFNPCFAAGTMVMTRDGHFPIEDLVGKVVEVWDGERWVRIDNFRVTAYDEDVYTVTLHSGQTVTATLYHKFVLEDGTVKELRHLNKGDSLLTHAIGIDGNINLTAAYLKGFLIGDGNRVGEDSLVLHLYEPKYDCADRLIESASEIKGEKYGISGMVNLGFAKPSGNRMDMQGLSARRTELLPWVTTYREKLPIESLNWTFESKCEFIAGVMDADGCACDGSEGFMYQITSVHPEWLKSFQLLLKSIGVSSKLTPARKGGTKDFGERGGICNVKDSYRITISQVPSIKLSQMVQFTRLTSFADKKVSRSPKDNSAKVVSVEFSHTADEVYCCTVPTNNRFSLTNSLVVGNCGEETQVNALCNLAEIHLNMIDPFDLELQRDAFRAGALSVCALLHHKFDDPKYQDSREFDPRVQVSFTGLFDFFVHAFGVDWLRWWEEGRPEESDVISDDTIDRFYKDFPSPLLPLYESWILCKGEFDNTELKDDGLLFKALERWYLNFWREVVEETVTEYCKRHGLRRPNRCTGVQPAGSKSLLTGASPGWHPPKAQRFIRRITMKRDHPVALACIDYGYNIVPSQSCKDENGVLLDDPFDPRVTEWLIEIPTEVSWASIPGVDEIVIEKFSALAQFDFYMQVQRHWTTINTSATIELREDEIEPLATAIYQTIQEDGGYVSAALQARFDAPFPRLPFEKIDLDTYERLSLEVLERRKSDDFKALLDKYDEGWGTEESPAACDSSGCLIPDAPKLNN